MWKAIAYTVLLLSLLIAALMTLREGAGAPLSRAAWMVFLVVAFVGYFAYWRKGPGPASHDGERGERGS
ncbi:MAG: hypothetical protein HKO53_12945 [Gemmatimonadetes bacterium]|nr:hypothetical protein [Gemmatimonadota bacterium]NNM33973.1 hypothetical protein [Gemmatimonadota bacterium]